MARMFVFILLPMLMFPLATGAEVVEGPEEVGGHGEGGPNAAGQTGRRGHEKALVGAPEGLGVRSDSGPEGEGAAPGGAGALPPTAGDAEGEGTARVKRAGECKDKYSICPNWVMIGSCQKLWMTQNCRKSCNKCCSDKYDEGKWWPWGKCPGWAAQHCTQSWMIKNCAKSCHQCGETPSSICIPLPGPSSLRLANIFGNNMVFQRAPSSPSVSGWGTPGNTVTVVVEDGQGRDVTNGAASSVVKADGKFQVKIGSYEAGTGFSIRLRETFPNCNFRTKKMLTDVAFGEVWVCSGQSNMQRTVKEGRKRKKFPFSEAKFAEQYENIRLLKLIRQPATEPQDEASGFYNPWSKPRMNFLDTQESFSAICLFFGEELWDELKVPVGLIESTYKGTDIEAWSPPEALEECAITNSGAGLGPKHKELWNSMINPLLKMSIMGAIWYQGENNAGYPFNPRNPLLGDYAGHNRDLYSCTFPAMIAQWRRLWNEATGGDTNSKFYFGFVQLGPIQSKGPNLAWPQLRWHQTADVGYVPNEKLENVFMATAVDSDIDLHPKNKRLTAKRLAWAAEKLVYKKDKLLQGPQSTAVDYNPNDRSKLVVHFNAKLKPVKKSKGFAVCCLSSVQECEKVAYGIGWKRVPITNVLVGDKVDSVQLDTSSACPGKFSGLAYLWEEAPCDGEESCPLYSAGVDADTDGVIYRLPVTPWKQELP